MAQTNLSKLQENYTCLAIICVDHLKLPLIDILNYYISASDIYTKIDSSTLNSEKKVELNQKIKRYVKGPGIPDYSKFDVSMLYTLIRNLCPLKPTGKWGEDPSAADTQLGDDIERVRLFRNRVFAHANSAQTPDSEFQNHWTYIKNVLNRIQKNRVCKSDYGERLASLERRLLNCEDLEKYKLLLEVTMNVFKEREDMGKYHIL